MGFCIGESSWNLVMAQMSRRFSFDDFEELCAEGLGERRALDLQMAEEERLEEEAAAWEEHDRVFLGKRPGEIGGVVTRLTFDVPDPPEAA